MTSGYKDPSKKTQVIQQQSTQLFAGPIPPPEILAKYDQLTPGLADRIVSMAERQSMHRQSLESANVAAEIAHIERRDSEAKRGQIFAFIIAITAIILGAVVVALNHPVTGGLLSALGLGGIVTAFIMGRK